MPYLLTNTTHPPLALQVAVQQAGLVPAAGRKLLAAAVPHTAAVTGKGRGKGNSSSLIYLRNATKFKRSKATTTTATAPSPSTSDPASSYFPPPAETAAYYAQMPDAASTYGLGQDQVLVNQVMAAAQGING